MSDIIRLYIVNIHSLIKQNKMEKTTTQTPKVGESIQNEKVEISLNHIAKENETARQFALRIAREKRKATNDAGKDMVKEIKNSFLDLSVIRLLFKENARAKSEIFCANLSSETGKVISVEDVYKLPIREYLDFVKETEAARNMLRGGITPNEFKNIITRYYRGEKCANLDATTRDILTDIHGA